MGRMRGKFITPHIFEARDFPLTPTLSPGGEGVVPIASSQAQRHLWTMDQSYTLSGMHCGNCVERITAALKPFADEVRVTLNPPRATLIKPKVSATPEALVAALSKAGAYTLTPAASPTLVEADEAETSTLDVYYPLLVIIGLIALASLAGISQGPGSALGLWMTNVMAGFFLVFGGFKLLNLGGFAGAYATYDLLAKRWPGYGYVYPFLELALGFAYLFRVTPTFTHMATVALMGFSSLGVIEALRHKRRLQCACLGTVLKLPMSTITLVEDLTMVAMAGLMLLTGGHN